MKYTKMEKNCFDISQLLITSHRVYTILDLVLESNESTSNGKYSKIK